MNKTDIKTEIYTIPSGVLSNPEENIRILLSYNKEQLNNLYKKFKNKNTSSNLKQIIENEMWLPSYKMTREKTIVLEKPEKESVEIKDSFSKKLLNLVGDNSKFYGDNTAINLYETEKLVFMNIGTYFKA